MKIKKNLKKMKHNSNSIILIKISNNLSKRNIHLKCNIIYFFQAIGNPLNDSLQIRAWDAVIPLISKLKKFYEFSVKLGMINV